MKASKAHITQNLERPDPAVRFYLFHGPDEAGSRALALKLLKGLGDAEKFIILGQSISIMGQQDLLICRSRWYKQISSG